MTCKCKRYDAWGNVILPHSAMLTYYANDTKSLEIVKRFMPHRYYVLPDVTIRINPRDFTCIKVDLVYPGETKTADIPITARVIDALRRTYRKRKKWVVSIDRFGMVIFKHAGSVCMETAGKYTARIPH